MAGSRFKADEVGKTISQYRKLAKQAEGNAARVGDAEAREWFLSLAKTMTNLAAALGRTPPDSN
jgi:hypothetical protein